MSSEEVYFCPNCMAKISSEDAVCPECGGSMNIQNSPHQLPVNSILNGRYLIGRVLGEGGFGITYLGYDLRTNTKAAIKEYFPSGLSYRFSAQSNTVSVHDKGSLPQYEKGKQRFLEEAKTVYRFRDEKNIVDVLDFFSENNTAYIVMEYIDGMSLSQYLAKNGPVSSFDELYKMLRPVMVSLSHVHDAGLIHRDISPSNLMIDKSGSVKLLDFGTARAMSEDGERSLSVVLKHGFAPMEQYQSHGKQGAWTDVYALCATVYKMLTGKTPTSAMDRLTEKMPSPSELGAVISPKQEEILLKGMAVLKDDRIQSVSELIELFDSVTKSEPEKKPKAKEEKTESNKEQGTSEQKPAKKKSNRGLLIALCVVILVVAAYFVIPAVGYNNAVGLMESGEYEEAIAKFEALNGYKDSKDKIRECALLKIQVGDYISFGSYEQDNDMTNGKEDIEWLVLDKQDNKILVISKYGLDAKPYNTEYANITWENCTLRSWLNDDFYNTAFSADEKKAIVQSEVSAEKNPKYDTNPGNDTTDKVFMLSISEVNKYFSSDSARQCAATDYAIAQGAWTSSKYTVDGKGAYWWWLRSPGRNQCRTARVSSDGSVGCSGDFVYSINGCVRPAMWINLDS